MPVYKDKPCSECGDTFTPLNSNRTVCDVCYPEWKQLAKLVYGKKYRDKQPKKPKKPNSSKGVIRTTGIGIHKKRSPEIRDERRYCERCGKDLKGLTYANWCTHHRDHDRTNNTEENFELLCKSCHAKEHRWADKFRENKV